MGIEEERFPGLGGCGSLGGRMDMTELPAKNLPAESSIGTVAITTPPTAICFSASRRRSRSASTMPAILANSFRNHSHRISLIPRIDFVKLVKFVAILHPLKTEVTQYRS